MVPKAQGEKKRLVLLDSHAILHRAYHAIPDFSTSAGEPSGALYGLSSMLLKIGAELHPDYVVACRDMPGATHRHEKFEAYKGTRAKTDDALISQLQKAPEVFEAFGIPVYGVPGYEADDCIGTIVREVADKKDIEVIIATGDMDTLQLVSDTVRVYTLRKGITDTVLYDTDRVKERYGFGPEHITDFKGLRGDPSDNIPGIKGVGEKTATELIGAFGSIEEMYRILETKPAAFEKAGITPRMVLLLKEGKEAALFSKELATIHPEVPIDFELPCEPWTLAAHTARIESLLDTLEFRSLKPRLERYAGAHAAGESESPEKGLFANGEAASPAKPIDPEALKEASVALWLLHSDIANPSLQEILDATHTNDFEQAREKIFAELRGTGALMRVYEEIEKPLIPIVARMHIDGIKIDVSRLSTLAREYSAELQEIAARLYGHAGHTFNINSPKQLGIVLYDELGLTLPGVKQKKTAQGTRTTREEELTKLLGTHPIVADVLAYREAAKLLSTYIEKLPQLVREDGRLHAEFLQAGAATGRMASQNPNVQNIPIKSEGGRRIRTAFVAEKGCVLAAIDYSQIELRIAAGLSGDEKLIQIFKSGGDIHAATAAEVFGVPLEVVDREMRRRAKIINFGILYGMGVNALRANLGAGVTRTEAANYLEAYFRNFSGLARYIEMAKASAAGLGYTETLFGRRRYFPTIKSALPGLRAQAERMAINAPIQGTQADIIKLAMIAADSLIRARGWREKAKLLLQVHDELVYEIAEADVPEIIPALRAAMEDVVEKDQLAGVPIIAEASLGPNWGELHKIERGR